MIIILVLALSVPIQKAKAVVGVDDAIILSAVASIFTSLGVKYISDAEWREGCQNFLRQAGEATVTAIKTKAELAVGAVSYIGYGFKMMFDPQTWKIITGDVAKYVATAYNSVSSDSIKVGSDGTLGFTKNSQFSVAIPGGTVQIPFTENCMLTLDSAGLTQYIYSALPYTSSTYLDNNNDSKYATLTTFSCFPFDLHYYKGSSHAKDFDYVGSLTSNIEVGFQSFSYVGMTFDSSLPQYGNSSVELLNTNSYSNRYTNMYTVDGQLCYFVQCTDNKYRFVPLELFSGSKSSSTDETCVPLVNSNTGETYLHFDKKNDMYYKVLDASGLRHYIDNKNNESAADVYVPQAVPISGSVPDVYDGSKSVGITVPDDLVKSNDMTTLNEMTAEDVIEYVDTTVDYPEGVPEIESGGLFDKFPFCLPKDIYNLFANFYNSNAKAPKFTIPVKIGQQDDGTYFVDYDIEIDLSFLDPVVPIFRFGISAGFVLSLILITRKMIGAQ